MWCGNCVRRMDAHLIVMITWVRQLWRFYWVSDTRTHTHSHIHPLRAIQTRYTVQSTHTHSDYDFDSVSDWNSDSFLFILFYSFRLVFLLFFCIVCGGVFVCVCVCVTALYAHHYIPHVFHIVAYTRYAPHNWAQSHFPIYSHKSKFLFVVRFAPSSYILCLCVCVTIMP